MNESITVVLDRLIEESLEYSRITTILLIQTSAIT